MFLYRSCNANTRIRFEDWTTSQIVNLHLNVCSSWTVIHILFFSVVKRMFTPTSMAQLSNLIQSVPIQSVYLQVYHHLACVTSISHHPKPYESYLQHILGCMICKCPDKSCVNIPVVPHLRRWRKFQNGGPIGEVGCCDSWMAERIHWLTERWLELCLLEWLELCLLEWLRWLQWSPHPQLLDWVWCSAAVVAM